MIISREKLDLLAFPITFHIFNNSTAKLDKLPKMSRLSSIGNFVPTPEKMTKAFSRPSNQKILLKLIINY